MQSHDWFHPRALCLFCSNIGLRCAALIVAIDNRMFALDAVVDHPPLSSQMFFINTYYDQSRAFRLQHALVGGQLEVDRQPTGNGKDANTMIAWCYDLAGGEHAWNNSIGMVVTSGRHRDAPHEDIDGGGILCSFSIKF